MKAYKGFNRDMTCRGFQYEEGKTYETDKAELCKKGFHACEDAVDCFGYYTPGESEYHEVELEDVSEQRDSDSKVAAKKIRIGAKLSIAKMVEAAINFRFSKTTTKKEGTNDNDSGAASATGYRGAASATGYRGAASATGDSGAASATGYSGAASATGYSGAASATGDRGAASATGKAGVAVAAGYKCMAKGAIGCALFLVERVWDEEKEIYKIAHARAFIVDGKRVKADTWYMLQDGKLIKAEDTTA